MHLASQGWLVTFGIKPQYPETGFGYIEATAGGALEGGLKVERFVEKPDAKTAESYVAAGNYFWNAGMFCFQVGTVIEEFKAHAPDVLEAVANTLAVLAARPPQATVALLWMPIASPTSRTFPSTTP